MAAIGSVIDGKYEILKLIGKGGMSKVYLAMDKRLNKQWAVKEIEKHGRDKNNAVVVQSAIAEANMIKKLDHPTLPRIVDIIDNGNVIHIIMDFIEGEALSKVLEREGAQSQEQVIEWAKELCEVLQYLHTREPKIIYRDMKPANVMLRPDGSLKLIDFGIAREYKKQNVEDTVSLGTKGYAAPEQFGGKGQTDERTDIYCLGVTLYHLITGQNPCEPPYELYPIRHWNPTLSSGLEAIIQKCTQLNPADRYQSCAELMYALERYEELDESYAAMQKAKLKKFVISASATLSTLVIACGCLVVNAIDVNKNYDKYIDEADDAPVFYEISNVAGYDSASSDGAINKYANAIELKPSILEYDPAKKDAQTNPYFAIIQLCKEKSVSGEVTQEELEAAISIITNKESEISNKDDFGMLAYEIGEYYLFYSPYTEQRRIQDSKKWLEYAADEEKYSEESFFESASTMMQIVEAYETSTEWKNRFEASKVKEFYNNQVEYFDNAASITDDVSSQYDIFRLLLLMYQDANLIGYLNQAGYSADDIRSLYDEHLNDEMLNSFGKDQKQELLNLIAGIEAQITATYGGGE